MSLKENIIKIWKSKDQIMEGITNSVFKKEDVEDIAKQRMSICTKCTLFDLEGKGCIMPGTSPCCNQKLGGCGCSLSLKTRSLSSDCPHPDGSKWMAVLTQEEEDQLNQKLGL
jgi:hypothetical protein